jgi:hypothetical protein
VISSSLWHWHTRAVGTIPISDSDAPRRRCQWSPWSDCARARGPPPYSPMPAPADSMPAPADSHRRLHPSPPAASLVVAALAGTPSEVDWKLPSLFETFGIRGLGSPQPWRKTRVSFPFNAENCSRCLPQPRTRRFSNPTRPLSRPSPPFCVESGRSGTVCYITCGSFSDPARAI